MIVKAKRSLIVGGALLAVATFSYAFNDRNRELTTVPAVDLSRYAGRWYEIARYPNRFQKQCTGNVTASYRLLPNGKVEVVNECRNSKGGLEVAKGKAKVDDRTTNAKLKLTFFWPFYGDYWVIGLDPDYRWAVVGEPGRKYLWILARSPELEASEYQKAVRILSEKGYEAAKLVRTPHLP
jgi:apolipoprotein D and lipocalin family protein